MKEINKEKILPKKFLFICLFLCITGMFLVMGKQVAFAYVPPAGSSTIFCVLLNLKCASPVGPVITNFSKSSTPPELLGLNHKAMIRISFLVPASAVGLSEVEVEEVLKSPFSLVDPLNAALTRDGINQPFSSPPVINPSRQGVRFVVGNLNPGNYSLNFEVEVPNGVADGTYTVENDSGSCTNGFNNFAGPAQIYYKDNSAKPGCLNLPNTTVFRREAKLIFNSDAWIGNKPLQAGNTIQIGPNTLIVSGQGASQGVSNYNLPTTGKNSWANVETLMRQRVERIIRSKSAQIVPSNKCPAGDVREVHLDVEGDSPFVAGNRTNQPKTWILNNCSFTLRDASFFGSGTIVNIILNSSGGVIYRGGVLNVYGALHPSNPNDTFGYITFRENATQNGVGHINLQGDSDPDNVAFFTSGVVDMGGNSTGAPIVRHAQVISRYIQFPPRAQMQNDIIFDRPTQLFRNVPPLFQQFSQPTGQEVP
jgi:hypothetical protein